MIDKTLKKMPDNLRIALLSAVMVIVTIIAAQSCVFDSSDTVLCPDGELLCPAGWQCAAHQSVCIPGKCGDGNTDFVLAEQCDDGNVINGDGCSDICTFENCGDGTTQPGEVCDDGNEESGDGCSRDCLSNETCG
ncbi:MAG: DUF4215 domain-containing protein, partial [Proteobacteria bacterium]|nr:DUF4215 domain-containing protein [Pseudomonadota bacterium]